MTEILINAGRMKRDIKKSGVDLSLASNSAYRNIAPVMRAAEVDSGHSFIGTFAGTFDARAQRCHRQHATAGGADSVAHSPGSGVKNLDIVELGRVLQSRDWFADFVFVGITARR